MNDLPLDGPSGDDDSSAKNTPAVELPGSAHDEASAIAGETVEQVGAAGGEAPASASNTKAERNTGRSAFLVGAGILISRIVGLIRQRVFAHYFGTSAAGDAFSAAKTRCLIKPTMR